MDDGERRERGGLLGAGEQQVLGRRELEEAVVGGPERRLRARDVVADGDARAEGVVLYDELVVVVAQAGGDGQVADGRELILRVETKTPPGPTAAEDEGVRGREGVDRIDRKSVV